MRSLTAGSGIPAGTLREVIGLVSGNPLSLHLAADVLNRTGEDPALLIAVGEGNVQGQLYARLLEHISDPRVRAVAHPGLIVRRITPGIIRAVLAKPCGIGTLSEAEAARVFEALRAEATLCEPSPDDDGALVHRQDVRAIMLPAITRDRPATTRAIHEAAVDYYTAATGNVTATGTAAAALEVDHREELYHRLMLGQDRAELDARWWQPAATDLTTVIEEFPASSRVYLTTKVSGLRLDAAARADADNYQWQQVVRWSALARMDAGQPREALNLIRERRGPGGGSLLPDLEIEALERLGRMREALQLVRTEHERAARDGDIARMRELITQEARILERMSDWPTAWELLSDLAAVDAERRARQAPGVPVDDEVRIQDLIVLTSMLRVARQYRRLGARLRRVLTAVLPLFPFGGGEPPARIPKQRVTEIQGQAVALAEATPERVLTANASLLRDLAAEIGQASPKILRLADGSQTGEHFEVGSGAVVISMLLRWLRAPFTRSGARRYQQTSDAAQEYGAATEPGVASFHAIQLSVGLIALLMPWVLTVGDLITGHGLPLSLSGFYYTPVRDILQCAMTAFGVLILTYHGYDANDRACSWAAGIFAVGFVLFPPYRSPYLVPGGSVPATLHLTSELGVFYMNAFIVAGFLRTRPGTPRSWPLSRVLSLFRPLRGPGWLPPLTRAVYRICGLTSLACAFFVQVAAFTSWSDNATWRPVYIAECVALTCTGVAWLVHWWDGLRAEPAQSRLRR
jgi:hypothetical protein